MRVTDVKYTPINSKNSVVGMASITLNDEFVVTGLKVIAGKFNPFVSFPQNKGKDDKYYDICFPVTSELRSEINNAVLSAAGLTGNSSGKGSKKEEDDFF